MQEFDNLLKMENEVSRIGLYRVKYYEKFFYWTTTLIASFSCSFSSRRLTKFQRKLDTKYMRSFVRTVLSHDDRDKDAIIWL